MDADMDIPLPDKPKWLEAHSRIHEEDPLDLQPPDPYPYPPGGDEEDEGEERNFGAIERRRLLDLCNPLTSSSKTTNALPEGKLLVRLRRSGAKLLLTVRTMKKDWLRYSPPPETNRTEVRVKEISKPEGVAISR